MMFLILKVDERTASDIVSSIREEISFVCALISEEGGSH